MQLHNFPTGKVLSTGAIERERLTQSEVNELTRPPRMEFGPSFREAQCDIRGFSLAVCLFP